jgi:hypothetical protein
LSSQSLGRLSLLALGFTTTSYHYKNTTNMPVALKRKGSPSLEEDADASERRKHHYLQTEQLDLLPYELVTRPRAKRISRTPNQKPSASLRILHN